MFTLAIKVLNKISRVMLAYLNERQLDHLPKRYVVPRRSARLFIIDYVLEPDVEYRIDYVAFPVVLPSFLIGWGGQELQTDRVYCLFNNWNAVQVTTCWHHHDKPHNQSS